MFYLYLKNLATNNKATLFFYVNLKAILVLKSRLVNKF